MWQELLIAVALWLVLEGILPFLSPETLRRMMRQMAEADDKTLRLAGLASMLTGVIMLYWIH